MPHFAITMGSGTILEAKNILMIVSRTKKAMWLQNAWKVGYLQITASAIQLHSGGITVVLDRDAASKLKNIDYYMHGKAKRTGL